MKRLFVLLGLCLLVTWGLVTSKNHTKQRSSMSERDLSVLGLMPDFRPWVKNPIPELHPHWEYPVSGLISFADYPMPSLTPGIGFGDQDLLYFYPRKFRKDQAVSFAEIEAVLTQRSPVQFHITNKLRFKRTRVYVGYISSFPRIPFNQCTKVGFVLGVGDDILPDWLIRKFIHDYNFTAWHAGNVLLAEKNMGFCVGDTDQSDDMRFEQSFWLENKIYTLMPDHQRGYG